MMNPSSMTVYYNSDTAQRAARIFKIVTLLASRRAGQKLGLVELAEACECSTKTIQRDVKCLQSVNVPLVYDDRERSYLLPETGWKYPIVNLSPSDVMALAVAKGLFDSSSFPLASQITAALDKASSGLTIHLRELLSEVTRSMMNTGGTARDYSQAPTSLLLEAMATKTTIEAIYTSARNWKPEKRLLDPYRLDQQDGRYFQLQAWCHRHKEVRTFALDRISEVLLIETHFTLQPWPDEESIAVGGMRGGKQLALVARFDPIVAPYARLRRWPFAAVFTDLEGGYCIMEATISGTDGILRELLSWRRHVEVLGSPELRAQFVEEIVAIAALYASQENISASVPDGHSVVHSDLLSST